MDGVVRVRTVAWFATAVVLAVVSTLLVTQAWSADAAPGDEDSTFIPVPPCRLDSRPAPFNVGPTPGPLGPGETNVYTQQVTGANGDCIIPPDAVAVSMNVTVVNGTAQSNLRVFPADVGTPDASNLNWLAGQSPTPNKVVTKLSLDGKIKLFNFAGTVNVLADVDGYFTSSSLKELAASAPTSDCPIPQDEIRACAQVTITPPVDGKVLVSASGDVEALDVIGGATLCSITTGDAVDPDGTQEIFHGAPSVAAVSLTRGFPAVGGTSYDYILLCETTVSDVELRDLQMTALFVAN